MGIMLLAICVITRHIRKLKKNTNKEKDKKCILREMAFNKWMSKVSVGNIKNRVNKLLSKV